jgi:hypothetical protein
MQAEKYLFHLSKWGLAGEKTLTQRYAAKLPPGMGIRITSTKAMIILGRDRRPNGSPALDASQQLDLEIIKRKYSNMIDIADLTGSGGSTPGDGPRPLANDFIDAL